MRPFCHFPSLGSLQSSLLVLSADTNPEKACGRHHNPYQFSSYPHCVPAMLKSRRKTRENRLRNLILFLEDFPQIASKSDLVFKCNFGNFPDDCEPYFTLNREKARKLFTNWKISLLSKLLRSIIISLGEKKNSPFRLNMPFPLISITLSFFFLCAASQPIRFSSSKLIWESNEREGKKWRLLTYYSAAREEKKRIGVS